MTNATRTKRGIRDPYLKALVETAWALGLRGDLSQWLRNLRRYDYQRLYYAIKDDVLALRDAYNTIDEANRRITELSNRITQLQAEYNFQMNLHSFYLSIGNYTAAAEALLKAMQIQEEITRLEEERTTWQMRRDAITRELQQLEARALTAIQALASILMAP